jgi:hypothetical protein
LKERGKCIFFYWETFFSVLQVQEKIYESNEKHYLDTIRVKKLVFGFVSESEKKTFGSTKQAQAQLFILGAIFLLRNLKG